MLASINLTHIAKKCLFRVERYRPHMGRHYLYNDLMDFKIYSYTYNNSMVCQCTFFVEKYPTSAD